MQESKRGKQTFRSVNLVALAIFVLVPSTALAAGDANTSSCGNEAMTGFRSSLPDCRAYEMVTPPFKDGGVVGTTGPVSVDGSRIATKTNSAFGGTPDALYATTYYQFERTAAGWATTALSPPAPLFPSERTPNGVPGSLVASADLQSSVWKVTTSATPRAEETFYVETAPGGPLAFVGPEQPPPSTGETRERVKLQGASSELTHLLVKIEPPSIEEREQGFNQPWPGGPTYPASELYEYTGTGNSEPVLVGVSNQERLAGKPHLNEGAHPISECGTTLGGVQEGGDTDAYNAVSASGETVFFSSLAGPCGAGGQIGVGPSVSELYARIGSSRTVAISEPSLAIPGRLCTGVCREDENEENGHQRGEGDFEGASEDGTRVFFTTSQPLVNEDSNGGLNLYEAQLSGPSITRLVQVSHDPHGPEAAEVQGVVRVSENGARVYFVATGVLTNGKNGEGREPEAGADNLYVYDTEAATTKFVGKLLTPPEEKAIQTEEEAELTQIGKEVEAIEEPFKLRAAEAEVKAEEAEAKGERARAVEEDERVESLEREGEVSGLQLRSETEGSRGPAGTEEGDGTQNGTLEQDKAVWSDTDERPAQATPDGRFLVFVSSAHLTGAEDTSNVAQLFEYDAESETLVRVSVGHDGYNDNGNAAAAKDAPHIPKPAYSGAFDPTAAATGLALSEDGSRVFFESSDGLAPQAVRGSPSVYEFRNGNVYLISDGHAATTAERKPSVKLIGTDASGQDVFFTTAEQLVPEDGDTQVDIYDAREGGGFPSPVLAAGCAEDACQGPLSVTPPLPVTSGSSTQAAGENLPPMVSKTTIKPQSKPLTRTQKLAKALKACRKDQSKSKRLSCEKQARGRYGPKPKAKAKRKGGK
jgi:hypothetical protein